MGMSTVVTITKPQRFQKYRWYSSETTGNQVKYCWAIVPARSTPPATIKTMPHGFRNLWAGCVGCLQRKASGVSPTNQAIWQLNSACSGGPHPQGPQMECPQFPGMFASERAPKSAKAQQATPPSVRGLSQDFPVSGAGSIMRIILCLRLIFHILVAIGTSIL